MMTFHRSTADDGHGDVAAISPVPLDKSTSRLSDPWFSPSSRQATIHTGASW
jgi:hypothetical protein